jgi:DNA-binding response OmpR family regulator
MARILVIEDDPTVRSLLAHILSDEGYQVVTAVDGHEGLDKVMEDPPDLLVLDLMMPVLDGYSVLEELKESGVGATLKTLVLSAKGAEIDYKRSFTLGAHRHMTKPFDPDELLAAIKELLEFTKEQLQERREQDRDRAHLLSQLESIFSDG